MNTGLLTRIPGTAQLLCLCELPVRVCYGSIIIRDSNNGSHQQWRELPVCLQINALLSLNSHCPGRQVGWPCLEIRKYLAVLSLPAGALSHAQVVGCTLYTRPHSLKDNMFFSSPWALTPWACVHLVYPMNAHGTVFIFPL